MRCQEFRELMDSYLGDELLVETNHDLLRHLENCAVCRAELAVRRQFRAQVRSAVKSSPEMQINSAFVSRLHTNLRDTALRPTVWEKIKHGDFFNLKLLTAVAACFLIVSMFGIIWVNHMPSSENTLAENNRSNQSIETPRPVESPIVQAVEVAWREIAQTAIGDHENCAVKFRLAEEPITLEQAAKKFGRFNKDLDKTVIASIKKPPTEKSSDAIEFLEAHSCVFQGRRFAHVVLKYHNRLVSVLVTDTNLPVKDSETIDSQSDGTMSVAGFRAARYAVFVVSDLTGAENSIVARTISPAVRRHIEKAEA